jgi:hypothetical protein
VATWWLVYRTRIGAVLRATATDPAIVASFGIPIRWVYGFTFMYGCGLAGLAGVLLSPIYAVFPTMGHDFGHGVRRGDRRRNGKHRRGGGRRAPAGAGAGAHAGSGRIAMLQRCNDKLPSATASLSFRMHGRECSFDAGLPAEVPGGRRNGCPPAC